MADKTVGQQMFDKLAYKKKNVFEEASAEKISAIFDYCEGYKSYLDSAKTEREAVTASIKMAEAAGYTEYTLNGTENGLMMMKTFSGLKIGKWLVAFPQQKMPNNS